MKFPFLPVAIWSTGGFLIWHHRAIWTQIRCIPGITSRIPHWCCSQHWNAVTMCWFSSILKKIILLLFDCCSFLHTVQLHHSASFCIILYLASIPCASCVDMLTHVGHMWCMWRSSGFVPWRPSKRNRQRRSRRAMDPMDPMDQKMLPQVVSESVTNFAAAQKIVAVVGFLDHVGPIPKDHALHAALLIFASQCHTVTASRYHGHVRHDRASIPDLQTLGCCICCLA